MGPGDESSGGGECNRNGFIFPGRRRVGFGSESVHSGFSGFVRVSLGFHHVLLVSPTLRFCPTPRIPLGPLQPSWHHPPLRRAGRLTGGWMGNHRHPIIIEVRHDSKKTNLSSLSLSPSLPPSLPLSQPPTHPLTLKSTTKSAGVELRLLASLNGVDSNISRHFMNIS